jgi:hypothetical protein
MRIYFNRKPVVGPWGGGTKVLTAIVSESLRRGHEVTYDPSQVSDLILCFDPRANQDCDFNTLLKMRHRDNSILVQRVGDLGTHGKPELLNLVKQTTNYADHVIFPSNWAKQESRIENRNITVIQNAPLKDFTLTSRSSQSIDQIKIVSHHWSDNIMKGFETYHVLDRFCQNTKDYKFTFIGRKPAHINIQNYIPPQDVAGLVNLISDNNLYVTASKKEAGANHVLEAIALGLPVLYHKEGGSINEYCENYGLQYQDDDDLLRLLSDTSNIKKMIENMPPYSRNSEKMAVEYIDLFETLYESKH